MTRHLALASISILRYVYRITRNRNVNSQQRVGAMATKKSTKQQQQKQQKKRKRSRILHGFPGFITQFIIRKMPRTSGETLLLTGRESLSGKSPAGCARIDMMSRALRKESSLLPVISPSTNSPSTRRITISSSARSILCTICGHYDLAISADVPGVSMWKDTKCSGLRAGDKEAQKPRLLQHLAMYQAQDRADTGRRARHGQTFKNHYESTKFHAEREVRNRMDKIPTIIIRPSIVVGHSKTGETNKYDGPYFPMRLILLLPTWLPSVYLGAGACPSISSHRFSRRCDGGHRGEPGEYRQMLCLGGSQALSRADVADDARDDRSPDTCIRAAFRSCQAGHDATAVRDLLEFRCRRWTTSSTMPYMTETMRGGTQKLRLECPVSRLSAQSHRLCQGESFTGAAEETLF